MTIVCHIYDVVLEFTNPTAIAAGLVATLQYQNESCIFMVAIQITKASIK